MTWLAHHKQLVIPGLRLLVYDYLFAIDSLLSQVCHCRFVIVG
jgi:hypothetical protein